MDEKDLYGSVNLAPGEVPPDVWGAAPARGKAIQIIEQVLLGPQSVNPVAIVDALTAAGLLVDELDPHDRMRRRINELSAVHRQMRFTFEIERERLRKQATDEGWLKS